MEFLTDIWTSLQGSLDWTIIILVWASGYLIARTKITTGIFPKLSVTLRVVMISFVLSVIYALFAHIWFEIWFASYFFAIGFHTAIIKLIETALLNYTKK